MNDTVEPVKPAKTCCNMFVATGILHNPNCVTKKPDDTIYFYSKTNKWAFLSNFWICDILIDGKTYKSTEHYFQAMKFVDPKIQQEIQESTSPSTVYKLANSRTGKYKEFIKINWENIKDQVMKDALRAKFTQNADLKKKLIETGNVKLVEASPTDSYWGHGKDKKGLNKLGKLLEEIRDEIKQKIDL